MLRLVLVATCTLLRLVLLLQLLLLLHVLHIYLFVRNRRETCKPWFDFIVGFNFVNTQLKPTQISLPYGRKVPTQSRLLASLLLLIVPPLCTRSQQSQHSHQYLS